MKQEDVHSMRSLRLQIFALLSCCALLPASALGGKEQPVTGLVGNLLQQPMKAPDFTLIDQHGSRFTWRPRRAKWS